MGSDTTRHDNGTGTGTGTTMFRICWQKHTTQGGRRDSEGGIHRNSGARQGVPLRAVPSSFKQLSNGFGIRNFRACEMTLLVSVTRYP